jgi:putative ABC transport system substrate-binding protein
MRRRQFIAGLGGVAAWPLAARAQQRERVRRIAVRFGNAAPTQYRMAAFRQRLAELGWIEGKNLAIEQRVRQIDPNRDEADGVREMADLIRTAPDVIVSLNTDLKLLKQATRTIPVVFALGNDPLGEGIVASLARPGGNMTGFASFDPEMGGKFLRLLKEAAPHITRVAIIYDPTNSGMTGEAQAGATAARSLELSFSATPVRNAAEIERAIEDFAREPNGGMWVPSNGPINANLDLIVALTRRHRIPTIGVFRFFAAAGGLMSYGSDDAEMFRGAATYVDRILKGEKPADLPVQYPTKFQFVINLTAAKAIGLDPPPALISLADEVIE